MAFVHCLATALHLRGVVRNDAGGVTIEGERAALDDLLRSLTSSPPAWPTRSRHRITSSARVALSGGVSQHRLLTEHSAATLAHRGFEILVHRQVPCNDGGLSLGQAYVAALTARRPHGTAPRTPHSAVGSIVGQETGPCA